jgi:cytochrome c-type biogenesis protein CcsB
MMESTSNLAQWAVASERAVLGASVVYAIALVAFLSEWALGRQVAREPSVRVSSIGVGVADPDVLSPATDTEPAGRRLEIAGRLGVSLTTVAALLHLAALVTRGVAAQRVPWGNMYEFALAGSFGAILIFLALVARTLTNRWLGAPLVFVVLSTLMAASLTLYVPAGPLVPALHSYWLVIHVVAAVLATGAFTLGAVASAIYLLCERKRRRRPDASDGPSSRLLPEVEAIDQLAYRVHAFAFPVWTFAALVAGPIWAKYAWGRYWGWDPKEVWAFITWVAYASYLHARVTGGWRGRKAAWVALAGFATLMFNFVGINLFGSGLHSYAGR